jgi:hypothetical protein
VQETHLKLPDETDRVGPQNDGIEAELQQLKAAVAELEPRARRYDRLSNELRSDDAPRALRTVLPLARLLRALGRLHTRQPVAPASQPMPPARSLVGSVRSACVAAAKAVLRPMTGPMRAYWYQPIHPLNQKLDTIAHELEALRRQLGSRNEAGIGAAYPSQELLRSIEALLLTIAARSLRDERK